MGRVRFRTPLLAAAACLLLAPATTSAATLGGVTLPPVAGVKADGPIVLHDKRGPVVKGTVGAIIGGLGYAPSKAPYRVKRVIWAANKIRHKPYKWGGGHGSWNDSGYDCSGSVSFALHRAGLLDYPLVSGDFMHWGRAGRGRWITVYATPSHAYMIVAGMRFDTAGAGESGPRWRPEPPWEHGFTAVHPPGF